MPRKKVKQSAPPVVEEKPPPSLEGMESPKVTVAH